MPESRLFKYSLGFSLADAIMKYPAIDFSLSALGRIFYECTPIGQCSPIGADECRHIALDGETCNQLSSSHPARREELIRFLLTINVIAGEVVRRLLMARDGLAGGSSVQTICHRFRTRRMKWPCLCSTSWRTQVPSRFHSAGLWPWWKPEVRRIAICPRKSGKEMVRVEIECNLPLNNDHESESCCHGRNPLWRSADLIHGPLSSGDPVCMIYSTEWAQLSFIILVGWLKSSRGICSLRLQGPRVNFTWR